MALRRQTRAGLPWHDLAALRPRYIGFLGGSAPGWTAAFQGSDVNRRRILWLGVLGEGLILFWGLYPLYLGGRKLYAWLDLGSPPYIEPTHCPRCGYDLQHNAEPGCPECGWGREGADETPDVS